MAMSLNSTGTARAEINMTPLIDVLLVLLIIFMVIGPVMSNGLGALVPQAPDQNAAASPTLDVILTVQADRSVRLNQEPVQLKDLGSRLRTLFKNAPDQPIFVRAGKDLDFEQVAEVIDIAKGVGLGRVALMTQ